ncbi:MAG: serine/threonine protein kinase, partial [Candidatus Obscuribacterales bacterium]|nr:serine/threonine protein kinase [Candidatus Obscuribacterales bacterium]
MESQQQGTEQENKACVLCGKEFPGTSEVCPDDGTLLTPIGKEPKIGDIFADKYEILGVLGDGGMGKVYKARHNLMKRVVALKMLLPHLVSSAAALKRFQQEAQAASALKHPHILTVHDFGISPKGMPYLVMDYLEGVSLSALLQDQGSLPQERCLNIFIQACSALSHAHKNGVVHRDLKPANLMLIDYDGTPDFVMIVDFGIAKLLLSEGAEQLTHTGEVFGSPLYMSPEQCRGKELDARSDIYSLGCVAYRTATGRPVFGGRDAMECMYKQVNDLPASFNDVCPELGLSEKFEAAIFKAIAKDPAQRYESMSDFRIALEEVRGGALPPAHKIFSVPPHSGQSVAYDAATDHLRKPNLGATQLSELSAPTVHEKSPAEIIGINDAASEPPAQDAANVSNTGSSAAIANTMVPPVVPSAPAGTETASIHTSASSQINLAHSTGATGEHASLSGSNQALVSNPSM